MLCDRGKGDLSSEREKLNDEIGGSGARKVWGKGGRLRTAKRPLGAEESSAHAKKGSSPAQDGSVEKTEH